MAGTDTRYLKGTLFEDNARKDLIVDDGRLTHGFIVKSFTMWPARAGEVGDFSAVLATKSSGASTPMIAQDNRQIGWAYGCFTSNKTVGITSILQPDEIVLEELIIVADWAAPFYASGINYLIELCPITISDAQSALVLINNKSQDI